MRTQQQPAALVAERVLDVAHRQAAGEELDRQPLQRLGPPLQVVADLRAERRLAAGHLRRSVVDQPLRRLQPPGAHAVAITAAGLGAAPIVVAAERVPALRLQRLPAIRCSSSPTGLLVSSRRSRPASRAPRASAVSHTRCATWRPARAPVARGQGPHPGLLPGTGPRDRPRPRQGHRRRLRPRPALRRRLALSGHLTDDAGLRGERSRSPRSAG